MVACPPSVEVVYRTISERQGNSGEISRGNVRCGGHRVRGGEHRRGGRCNCLGVGVGPRLSRTRLWVRGLLGGAQEYLGAGRCNCLGVGVGMVTWMGFVLMGVLELMLLVQFLTAQASHA